ncbi:MAG: hypothetical protein K2P93_01490 [Alphaproteobacteria bacterium]|nr:hypothetical protein [Alphaproteobacteria bacterium]
MFNMIEPKDLDLHRISIDPLLKSIQENTALRRSFRDHKNATFIIAQDVFNGIQGGAVLTKKKLTGLRKKGPENKNSFLPYQDGSWMCTLSLYLDELNFNVDFEAVYKSFYFSLYKEFMAFGAKNKIESIYVTLTPGEYLCTEAIGFWPYLMEIRPHESLDGLFHGILCLTDKHPGTYNKAGKNLSSQAEKLAA